MNKLSSMIAVMGAITILVAQPMQTAVMASIMSPVTGGSEVYGTGNHAFGQIGIGDDLYAKLPAKFELPSGLTAVSMEKTLANVWVLASDNQVYGAGYNSSGELGDGTTNIRNAPVRFQLPVGLTAVAIHANNAGYVQETALHVLASDGQVYSAGHNQYGEFGNGAYVGPLEHNPLPTRFQLPVGVTALEMQTAFGTLFVRGSDGNVYGAGYNNDGMLGNNSFTNATTPVVMQLPVGVTAKDIVKTAGYGAFGIHVIGSDDQLYSAGSDYGMFGSGSTAADQPIPVKFNLPVGLTVKSVLQRSALLSVIASDDQIYNTGRNFDGQLGDGTTTYPSTPVKFQLPVGVNAVDRYIAEYSDSQQVLGSDGKLYSAGFNDYGRFGIGNVQVDDSVMTPTPFILPVGVQVVKVQQAWHQTFILGSDGKVYAAGSNQNGEAGNGTTISSHTPTEVTIPVGVTVTDITYDSPGESTSVLYIKASDGRLFAVGDNSGSMVGIGTRGGNVTLPAQVLMPSGVLVNSVYVGKDATSQVMGSDNQIYSLGYNRYGQTGSGSMTSYVVDPTKFVLPVGISAVRMLQVNDSTAVLGTDGNVYTAGTNTYGQLGDGTTLNRHTPVRFQLPVGVTGIELFAPTGATISVLASDGQVYSAGYNPWGMLGIGVTASASVPAKFILPGGVTVAKIASSYGGTSGGGSPYNMSVIGSNGVTYTAGSSGYGQLGNGVTSFTANSTPQPFTLPVGLTSTEVFNMENVTAVLASDGNVYMAGINSYGLQGNGNTLSTSTPGVFQLPVGVTAVDFDGTPYNSFVVASDGQLYGAGFNTNGELGDGSTTHRSIPVRFGLPVGLTLRSNDITEVSIQSGFGASRISVIASDDNIYTSGYGGKIGTGVAPGTTQSTPILLPMPGGLSVTKFAYGYNPGGRMAVIASDGQFYQAGSNANGELGDGTTTTANSMVRFNLPPGVNAVDAIIESNGTIVLGSNGRVYTAGADSSGWLGAGTNTNKTSVVEYNLPVGVQVDDIQAIMGKMLGVVTAASYAVGGQTFCDLNSNTLQDSGESMVNGQAVSVYRAVSGTASGPAVASFTTQDYLSDSGVFFFDGLDAGDYVIGLTTDSGVLYSSVFTLDGSGDGWILGNSAYINTVSAMGQTGFVCGTSTTAGDNDTTSNATGGSGPGTGILAPTGMSLLMIAGFSVLMMVVATITLLKQRKPHVQVSRL